MPEYKTYKQKRAFYLSKAWKQLRQAALERDNYECQHCKEQGKVTTKANAILEVDHIKEIEHRPDLARDLDNLQTLCKDCHNKKHNRFGFRKRKKNKWQDDEWW